MGLPSLRLVSRREKREEESEILHGVGLLPQALPFRMTYSPVLPFSMANGGMA